MHLFVIKYKRIIYYILGICLLQGFVSDYIGFHQINYLCDVLLIFLLLLITCKKKNKITRTVKNAEYFSIAVFVVAVLMGWMLNSISIPRALWGVRNYGRFFLFYVFAKYLWTEDDVKLAENLFLKLFPIHVILVSFQYIVEGLNQDLLSGIFGKVAGGNGGLVIYLSIILSIAICRFEYKIIDIRKFICYLLLIFINAALSELKFFFVLSIFLVVWYIAMSKRKGRGMALALFFIIALYIGLQIFYYVFPFWRNYLSLGNI